MKRCMLLNVLLWVLGVSAFAQTQGIAFETSRSWKKVVEKAPGGGEIDLCGLLCRLVRSV